MFTLFRILLLTIAFSLSACASTLKVTYQSDPPGAVLYSGTQMFGYTPYTAEYQVSDSDRQRGKVELQGTTVKWASGASAQVPSLTADLKQFGMNQQFNFQRPESYPGREADMRFALELQKLAIMKQQASAQEAQTFLNMMNIINQQNRAQQRAPTNCTSTVIGNTVQTNCY